MPLLDSPTWSTRLHLTLEHYDEPLLRQVANKLCKPRSQWPAEELIERCLAATANPAMIDRRLSDLELASMQILALMGHSREPRWRVGNLVEMAISLGHEDGLAPVVALLEAGLLYPDLSDTGHRTPDTGHRTQVAKSQRLKSFERWLGYSEGLPPTVFAPPEITERALRLGVEFPACPGVVMVNKPNIKEADGLDIPLRLAALWQQVHAVPLRRTQTTGFFKRDLERLRADPLLCAAPPNALTEIPDPSLLTVVLAVAEGLVVDVAGELRSGKFPASWNDGMLNAVASLWIALLEQAEWTPHEGWRPEAPAGNPYPSTWLLALVLLSRLPPDSWSSCESLEKWVAKNHPAWRGGKANCGLVTFLLGLAFPLRLIQATEDSKVGWLVRLSPLGRWLLGMEPEPALAQFGQTLLVQPNLEILAYRQGLAPALIAVLTKLADWKTLGAACTLQLEPASVYRALEAGETFETIQQMLQRHGMKPTPEPVVAALRTWASKRDRIRVYTGGALFEFNSPDDLEAALARGLPAVRLSERLAVVANDRDIDYRHFRLTATRDYALPLERCVQVESDGVTLVIDMAKSDLLVETEVRRFAELLERPTNNGQRMYHLTPESLGRGRDAGIILQTLETWFQQRSGQPLPAATRLLFAGSQVSPYELKRPVVLHVPITEMADGLMQWPETRGLIETRLGPTALAVAEENVAALKERLDAVGVKVQG